MTPSSPAFRDLFAPFGAIERRKSVRHPCKIRVAYQPGAADAPEVPWLRGAVLDVSAGGVRLSVGQRFEPGALLTVALPRLMRGRRRLLQARVAHLAAGADGAWDLGCALVNCSLTAEELRALPAPRTGA